MSTPDTSGTYHCVTIPAQPGVPSTLPSLTRQATYGWDASAISDTALASPVDLRFSIEKSLIGGVIGFVSDSAAGSGVALTPEDIAAGFYFSVDSSGRALFQIIESGRTKSSPKRVTLADEFRITQTDGAVRYYRNGLRLRASDAAVLGEDIRVGCAMYASGDQFPATTEVPAPPDPDVWVDMLPSLEWLSAADSAPVTLPFTHNDLIDFGAGIYASVTPPEGSVIRKIRVTGTLNTVTTPAETSVEMYFNDVFLEDPVSTGLQTFVLPATDVTAQLDPDNPTLPVEFWFDAYSPNSGTANITFDITQFDAVLGDAPPAPAWVLLQDSALAYTFTAGAAVSLVGSHAVCDPASAPPDFPDPFLGPANPWKVVVNAPGALLRITPVSYSITNPWASTGPGAIYHAGHLRGDSGPDGTSTTFFENEAAPWPSSNFSGTSDVVGWSPTDPVPLYVTEDGGGKYSVGYEAAFGSDGRQFWEHYSFKIEVWETPSTGGGGDVVAACFWDNLIGVEQDCG